DDLRGGDDAGRKQPMPSSFAKIPAAAGDPSTTKVTPAAAKSVTPTSGRLPKKVVVEADEDDPPANGVESPPAKVSARPAIAVVQTKTTRRQTASISRTREAQPTSSGDRSLIRALGL